MFDDFSFQNIEQIAASMQDEAIKIPLEQISLNPYQYRKHYDETQLNELAASIQLYGILQPLIVVPGENGKYVLISGERRLFAAKAAKLTEVPVIITDYTPRQIAEISIIENLRREDIHFLEEAEGYDQLLKDFDLTQEAVAQMVGKKQSTIANKLRLLKLSPACRKLILSNNLSERHARAVLKLETDEKRQEILQEAIQRKLSVRQTEKLIETLLKVVPPDKKRRMGIVSDVRAYVNDIKELAANIKEAGIPVILEQEISDEEVIITLRIKNQNKPKGGYSKPLF